MLSWIQDAHDTVTSAATNFFALEEGYNQDEERNRMNNRAFSGPSNMWEETPASLMEFSKVWHVFTTSIMLDENSYVICPTLILERRKEDLERLGILEFANKMMATMSVGVPDGEYEVPEETQRALVANESVKEIHFAVMPKYVSNVNFWRNIFWRLFVYHECCTSIDHLLEMSDALQLDPRFQSGEILVNGPRLKGQGRSDQCSALQRIKANVLAAREDGEWLNEKEKHAKEVLKNGASSRQLLINLLDKQVKSSLGDSVLESCIYHETKLGSVLGDLADSQEKVSGSSLDTTGRKGTLYHELLLEKNDIRSIIQQYTSFLNGEELKPQLATDEDHSVVISTGGESMDEMKPLGPYCSSSLTSAEDDKSLLESLLTTASSHEAQVCSADPSSVSEVGKKQHPRLVSDGADDEFYADFPWSDGDE